MKPSRILAVLCLFALAILAGCASSTITALQEYRGEKIARPDHILVYDFAATSAKVEGRAEDTAKEIATELKKKFKEQGWI